METDKNLIINSPSQTTNISQTSPLSSPKDQDEIPKHKGLNKSGSLIISIAVIVVALILGVGGYLISKEYKINRTTNQTSSNIKNQSDTKINGLTWEKDPYKIYYMNDNGIFTQYTNGTNKKSVYKYELYKTDDTNILEDYYLINATKRLLIIRRQQALLVEGDGTNTQTLLKLPASQQIAQTRVSPDGQKLIVWVFIGEDIPYDIYLINLAEKSPSKLSVIKEKLNYDWIENIFWYKNSNEIILITHTKIIPGDDYYWQYSTYSIASGELKVLAKQPDCIEKGCIKLLSHFLDKAQIAEPEPEDEGGFVGKFNQSISPDGTKIVDIKEGNISVDGVEVMHWDNYDIKFNNGYHEPKWLPDNNHLIVTGTPKLGEFRDIRVIEIDTRRVAKLDDGYNVKWFNEELRIPGLLDYLISRKLPFAE